MTRLIDDDDDNGGGGYDDAVRFTKWIFWLETERFKVLEMLNNGHSNFAPRLAVIQRSFDTECKIKLWVMRGGVDGVDYVLMYVVGIGES
jgi:hypothetical protein